MAKQRKRIVVLYLDVGNLPKKKSEEYGEEFAKKLRGDLDESTALWVIPTRHGGASHIEVLPLD